MPSLAFIGYGALGAHRLGRLVLDRPDRDPGASSRRSTWSPGLDRSNPPDDVIEALEQDRYYRWITYLFLPIQYVGFVGAMSDRWR